MLEPGSCASFRVGSVVCQCFNRPCRRLRAASQQMHISLVTGSIHCMDSISHVIPRYVDPVRIGSLVLRENSTRLLAYNAKDAAGRQR